MMFEIPHVVVQLLPKFSVYVNGARRDKQYAFLGTLAMTKLGGVAGWARRHFNFGYERAAGPIVEPMNSETQDPPQASCPGCNAPDPANGFHNADCPS